MEFSNIVFGDINFLKTFIHQNFDHPIEVNNFIFNYMSMIDFNVYVPWLWTLRYDFC